LEIIKKVISLTAIVISMWYGVIWMARSLIITSVLSQIINSYPNKKLLNYRYTDQLRDMLPQIGLSCLMGAIVYCVTFLNLNEWLTLLIQVPLGVVIYIVGSKLLRIDSFEYVCNIAKGYLHRGN
jgi:hypothetical protein